jgi:hypothetical protein
MKIKQFSAFLLATALVLAMLPTMAFATAAPAPSDSSLSRLTLSGVALDGGFSSSTHSYDGVATYSVDSTRVTATARNSAASVTVNGQAVDSNNSVTVPLTQGGNTVTVVVSNPTATASETTYSVYINKLERGETAVNIRTDTIPDGAVGHSYSAQFSASGSGEKYWYCDGTLPDGLSFNQSTGRITGTPRAGSEGHYTIYVSVESDSNSTSDEDDFNFSILERGSDLNDDDDEPASSTAASRPAASRPAATSPAAQTSGVSQATLISQAQSRIDSAAAGAAVSLRYRNLGMVELETLQAIGEAAGNHAISLGSERQDADGNVESRVTIDPKKSTKDISLLSSTTISSENCRNVTEFMNRYYSNQVSVIRLDQKGSYGQTVTVYAKLDNARLNTSALRFYSYDSAANKLEAMTTGYRVNESGYVTFNSNVGNYVIVTDSAMKRK